MGVIRQIDLLGGSAENIASGLDFPTDVALSRILSRVFWIDSMTDSIHRLVINRDLLWAIFMIIKIRDFVYKVIP